MLKSEADKPKERRDFKKSVLNLGLSYCRDIMEKLLGEYAHTLLAKL